MERQNLIGLPTSGHVGGKLVIFKTVNSGAAQIESCTNAVSLACRAVLLYWIPV